MMTVLMIICFYHSFYKKAYEKHVLRAQRDIFKLLLLSDKQRNFI